MAYQTLSYANAFAFTCPIFNVETKMAGCVKLRDLVWRGKTVEVRRGCQVCMKASKCPAAVIVQSLAMSNRPQPDDYGSVEPRSGKLRKDVLERILPVVVMEADLGRYGVPAAEVALIQSANERIAAQLGHAPGASQARAQAQVGTSRRKTREKAAPASSAALSAAETGDLSAAINNGN